MREHLFPLTATGKPLYLPLPVVGSLYPLFVSQWVPLEWPSFLLGQFGLLHSAASKSCRISGGFLYTSSIRLKSIPLLVVNCLSRTARPAVRSHIVLLFLWVECPRDCCIVVPVRAAHVVSSSNGVSWRSAVRRCLRHVYEELCFSIRHLFLHHISLVP